MDVEEAFALAHEAALLGCAELITGLGGDVSNSKPVFPGAPPTGQATPYVIFEEPEVLDDKTECLDGWEIFATTRVVAKRGRQPLTPRALAGIVRRILNADLGLQGFRTVDWRYVGSRPQSQADGSTLYSITHRYLIEPSA